VDDALLVRGLEGFSNLQGQLQGFLNLDRAGFSKYLSEEQIGALLTRRNRILKLCRPVVADTALGP
jgi:hypothetical protein